MSAPVTVPIGRLVSKILCRNHNSVLGEEVDAAGKAFIDEMAAMVTLHEERVRMPRHGRWPLLRRRVDGALLERWFVKTLVNLTVVGQEDPIGGSGADSARPARELVEVVFGERNLEGYAGLYLGAAPGMRTADVGDKSFIAISHGDPPFVSGGLFVFAGWPFLIWLVPDQPPPALGVIVPQWSGIRLVKRMTLFEYKVRRHQSQRLEVRWPPSLRRPRRRAGSRRRGARPR